jgi:ABC-type transporter MlaC component
LGGGPSAIEEVKPRKAPKGSYKFTEVTKQATTEELLAAMSTTQENIIKSFGGKLTPKTRAKVSVKNSVVKPKKAKVSKVKSKVASKTRAKPIAGDFAIDEKLLRMPKI